jgi:cell division septum initiation protein DivIVA
VNVLFAGYYGVQDYLNHVHKTQTDLKKKICDLEDRRSSISRKCGRFEGERDSIDAELQIAKLENTAVREEAAAAAADYARHTADAAAAITIAQATIIDLQVCFRFFCWLCFYISRS